MYTSNPYAQSWSNAGNGQSNGNYGSAPPSVFGALPYPGPSTFSSPSDLTTFYFTSFNPTILNCTVIGRQSQPVYQVTADSAMPGYTVFKDVSSRNIALIEWQAHPAVEVRNIVPRQIAQSWLRLSSDRSYRTMDVRGTQYVWAPSGQSICLYTKTSSPIMLARISKSHALVTLEMTSHAIQLGLVESAVVATVLLQCGRNID